MALVEYIRKTFNRAVAQFRRSLFLSITLSSLLLVLLWSSAFLYGSFYYAYIPSHGHSRDVQLQLSDESGKIGKAKSYPTSNFTLIPNSYSQLLTRGQSYHVVLELHMPESPVNQALGMFMVKLDFFSYHGFIVNRASRAAMIEFKNSLLQTFETLTFMPLYLIGWNQQKQTIHVNLFDNYQEDPYRPTVGAKIQIQSQDVHIYSATLHILANFTGLRYLMFYWPVTFTILGVSTIMFFLTIIVLLSWYNLTSQDKGPNDELPDTQIHIPGMAFDEDYEDDKDSEQLDEDEDSHQENSQTDADAGTSLTQTRIEDKPSPSSSTGAVQDLKVGTSSASDSPSHFSELRQRSVMNT